MLTLLQYVKVFQGLLPGSESEESEEEEIQKQRPAAPTSRFKLTFFCQSAFLSHQCISAAN